MWNMEDMDIDQIVEIPDTPDRVVARRTVGRESVGKDCSSSLFGTFRNTGNHPVNGQRANDKLVTGNGHCRKLVIRPPKPFSNLESKNCSNSSAFASEENSSASQNGLLFRRAGLERGPNHKAIHSIGVQRMDKGKSIRSEHPSKSFPSHEGAPIVDLTERNGYTQRPETGFPDVETKDIMEDKRKGQIASNGSSLGPYVPESWKTTRNGYKGKEKIDESVPGTAMAHGESVKFSADSQLRTGEYGSSHYMSSPRSSGRRMLVRNGCISPNNIAKAKLAELHKNGSKSFEQSHAMNGVSSCAPSLINISDVVAEESNFERVKGKAKLTHAPKEHNARSFLASSSPSNEEANGTSDGSRDAFVHTLESGGWRSTRLPSQGENTLIKRQKKQGSGSRPLGDFSTSIDDDLDIMFAGTSRESMNSRSSRVQSRSQAMLAPIIDVDNLSPAGRHSTDWISDSVNNDDSVARARQVEADEMLARELQEQLYDEMPIVGSGEVDEHLAWVLQQEENEFDTATGSHPGSSMTSHLHRQPRSRSSQNPSNRRGNQARVPSSSTRMGQLRRRVNRQPTGAFSRAGASSRSGATRSTLQFPLDMDLDMRLNILEVLEAAVGDISDVETANNLYHHRDFNENDYEMLLALDEHNHQHAGASVNQINSLPQSVVQNDNFQEACAVCLETPTTGETVRHLPCLHKFHKDCIDPWLTRKRSCPVCKCSIT